MTFSLRETANTMTSAMSSGVKGSTPLAGFVQHDMAVVVRGSSDRVDLRVDGVRLGFVAVKSDDTEVLQPS